MIARKLGEAPPDQRRGVEVATLDGYVMIRYHLGSDQLRAVLEAVGGNAHFVDRERAKFTAMFGVHDQHGKPQIVFDVVNDRQEGPKISFVFAEKNGTVPSATVAGFLSLLDVPASWRAGADAHIADLFDAFWDKDSGGWVQRKEVNLVRVTFERLCFATRPPMRESVDVFLLPSPERDINDPNEERAYWAKDHYREAAWEEFHRLPQSGHGRPGFSSWSPSGEPQLVKVVREYLDNEIARLTAEVDAAATEQSSTEPEPPPPGRP